MTRRERGHTLIGLLAAMAIIAVLGVSLFYGSGAFQAGGPKSPRKDGKGTTIPGLVKAKAQDGACQSNLNQVRLGIQVAETSGEDSRPQSLQELRLGSTFLSCPLGKEPYQYDPSTGKVQCPHPGHEKF